MAVDYFLKIDGVDGESKDDKHAGEIDVLSWSWGATQTGTSSLQGGSGAGKVSMHDFNFVMPVSIASPTLMLACASGKHLDSALLTCRKAGTDQQEYLKVTMSDLIVSSFQTGGSAHNEVATDQISLNFAKVVMEYAPQKDDGTLDASSPKGWDVKANKAV